MAELPQETAHVVHHRQKVLAFFAAMRRFASALERAGHRVRYFTLDDSAAYADLPELLRGVIEEESAEAFAYQWPDEYRLDQQLADFARSLDLPVSVADTEHFLTARDAWEHYSTHRMEYFYRALRREYQVLLDDDGKPLGGQWNFDADNRARLPRETALPEPLVFATDVTDIDQMLNRHDVQTLGVADPSALLAGVHPDALDHWYLGIYIDAIEWVELPNTRGMSQYADGGLMGSKPYAASGQYINKMSHYCKTCVYDVKAKTGEGSCSFNSLYWHFLNRHRDRLGDNPRMKLVYANWDRQAPAQRQDVLATAEAYITRLNTL